MITIAEARGLSFAYGSDGPAVLSDVDFAFDEGELVLTTGPSGGGKSTLLRCLNGLVPHFHGGRFAGTVRVGGLDTRDHQPRELAGVAGMVFQEPEAQVVAGTVEEEIVFGLENAGVAPVVLRKRLEESLDALGIAHLRHRKPATLSGGELQRVAIASVLTMQPRLLLLDEPTSQLDPQAAEDVLGLLGHLRGDLGLTVVVAEHRLERLAQYADRVLQVPGDGSVRVNGAREALAASEAVPAVAAIGRALGWSPLPLSVAEGRRFAGQRLGATAMNGAAEAAGDVLVSMRGLGVTLGGYAAVRDVTLDLREGEVVALMGRNGAGKTTLLRTIAGLQRPDAGGVTFAFVESAGPELYRCLAFVAQDPASLLYHEAVRDEIEDVLRTTKRAGSVGAALDEWQLASLARGHPADLSVGQRQRAALAAMLCGAPSVALLDEPTRGMDHETKELLVANVRRRAAAGACVVLASHDVELAARAADRVVLLAEGEVIAEGPARSVLTESMAFSTQANKLFGGDVLTVEDALRAARNGT
jgi:energy-coupling factor transport system ATP-binding protein